MNILHIILEYIFNTIYVCLHIHINIYMYTYTYSKIFTYNLLKKNANVSVCNTFKCCQLDAEMAKHLTNPNDFI